MHRVNLKEIEIVVEENIGVETEIVKVIDFEYFDVGDTEDTEVDRNFVASEKSIEGDIDLKTEGIVIEQNYWQAVTIVQNILHFYCIFF